MPFWKDEISESFIIQVLERYWEEIHDLSIVSGKMIYEAMKLWSVAENEDEVKEAWEELTHTIFHIVSTAYIEGLREGLTRYARGDLSTKKKWKKG